MLGVHTTHPETCERLESELAPFFATMFVEIPTTGTIFNCSMGQWALHTCLSRRRKAVHDTPEAQHLSVVLVALGEVISRETMTS